MMYNISSNIDKKEIMEEFMEINQIKNPLKRIEKMIGFYDSSILLKNIGSLCMIDPTISAISGKFAQKENQRIKEFMELVNKRLKLVENRIDKDFIETEEFMRVLFKTLEKAKEDYRENKLIYYANILTNYSTKEYSRVFSKESILDRVFKYTEEHIFVLYSLDSSRNEELHKEFNDDYEISRDIREVCISDLISDGLLKRINGSYLGNIGSYYITELGKKFIDLVIYYE